MTSVTHQDPPLMSYEKERSSPQSSQYDKKLFDGSSILSASASEKALQDRHHSNLSQRSLFQTSSSPSSQQEPKSPINIEIFNATPPNFAFWHMFPLSPQHETWQKGLERAREAIKKPGPLTEQYPVEVQETSPSSTVLSRPAAKKRTSLAKVVITRWAWIKPKETKASSPDTGMKIGDVALVDVLETRDEPYKTVVFLKTSARQPIELIVQGNPKPKWKLSLSRRCSCRDRIREELYLQCGRTWDRQMKIGEVKEIVVVNEDGEKQWMELVRREWKECDPAESLALWEKFWEWRVPDVSVCGRLDGGSLETCSKTG